MKFKMPNEQEVFFEAIIWRWNCWNSLCTNEQPLAL